MDLSVIVPIHNEEKKIRQFFILIKEELDKLNLSYEIIFVDDGSDDRTFTIAKEIKLNEPSLKLIRFRRTFGITQALVAGINHAKGKIIVLIEESMESDPADILRLLLKIHDGYHVVCGYRDDGDSNFFTRTLPSLMMNNLISYTTKVWIHDFGCKLKAFRHEIIKELNLYLEMHRFIPVIAASAGGQVSDVEITSFNLGKKQTENRLNKAWKILFDLLAVKIVVSFSSRPHLFFGLIGFISTLLGIILSILYCRLWFTIRHSIVFPGIIFLHFFLSFSMFSYGIVCSIISRFSSYQPDNLIKKFAKEINIHKNAEV